MHPVDIPTMTSTGTSVSRPPRLSWVVAACLAFATFLAYANSFRGVFVLDDIPDILQNPAMRSLQTPVATMFHGHKLPARALPYLTFAVDHALWGTDPFGYHVTNLVIHIIAAIALFDLAQVTLTSPRVRERFGGLAVPLAAGIALLWAVHPLQTQSVTYVYQRIESLNGMFCLIALTAFARAAFGGWSRWWLGVSFATTAAAMLCKENAVALPFLLVTYDWCFVAGDLRAIVSRWRWYASVATTWLLLALQIAAQAGSYGEFSERSHTVVEYALTQPGVILRYITMTFWPFGQQIHYDWPIARQPADWLPHLLVLAVPIVITLSGFWQRAPWSWLGVAFFLALGPTSSFMPVKSPIGEQRMYLPLAAVLAAVLLGGTAILQSLSPARSEQDRPVWPWLLAAGTLFWATWLGSLTHRRNELYHDRARFWADHIVQDPKNSTAFAQLSQLAAINGDPEEAVARARRAVELDARTDAMGYLAGKFLQLGDDTRAEATSREGLEMIRRLLPKDSRTVLKAAQGRANMLYDQKRFAEAEAICTAEVDAMDRVLGPGHRATIEARTILAEAALRQGELVEAERIGRQNLERAMVGVGPGDPAAQAAAVPLVKSLHASGRGDESETILRDLIAQAEGVAWRRVPDLRTARKTLAGLLEAEGRHDQAAELRSQILATCEGEFGAADLQTIRAAIQLDTCVAAAAIAKGDLAAAAKTARHGLDLATSELGVADPLAQTTAVALARILSQSGREDEAEILLREYLAEVARATPEADAAAAPIDATTIQKALAAILEQSGRATEAIPLWRSILRQYLKTRGPDDNATQQAAQVLQKLLARPAADRPAAEKPAASQPAATPPE